MLNRGLTSLSAHTRRLVDIIDTIRSEEFAFMEAEFGFRRGDVVIKFDVEFPYSTDKVLIAIVYELREGYLLLTIEKLQLGTRLPPDADAYSRHLTMNYLHNVLRERGVSFDLSDTQDGRSIASGDVQEIRRVLAGYARELATHCGDILTGDLTSFERVAEYLRSAS